MQLEWIEIDKPKFFTKRRIIGLAVIAACLLLFGALTLLRSFLTNRQTDTRAAERFAPDGGYAQVSVYFSEGAAVDAAHYREFIYRIETALTVGAIEQDAENPDARLFLTCYSSEGRVTLSRDAKTAEADAIGTEGDFFFMHPVDLVSGMYYRPDALMKDQVLLSDTVAWQLFGGTDIAGQEIMVGGKPHYVSGVFRTGDGRMRKAAGSAESLVFLSAESLNAYGTVNGGAHTMNCFEAVMPNPVRGFAASTMRAELKAYENRMAVIDQNVRFGNFALWKVLTDFGTRSMAGAAMRFPYWENLARGTEDVLVIILICQALLLAVPVLLLTVFVVQAYRHKRWTAGGIVEKISDRIYDIRSGQRRIHT
ncbi:MAG: ABC transporter permease [Lachnospiraceae bacterium]|nr:ABC transporter permease [Lachnospiraceae bacterium]